MRNFYVNKLVEVKKEEKKEMDKSNKGSKPNFNTPRPNIPRR